MPCGQIELQGEILEVQIYETKVLMLFQVFVILLAVIAILASSARLIFRYRGDRTLHLEDYLVGFASICLVIETGLLYDFNRVLYMIDGATLHKPVLAYIGRDPELTKELLDSGPSTLVAYFTLGWLAIWAIKYSFLALFYKMLRNVSRKLTAYFWCTVAATGMSGVVVILESFILCPHFGADAGMTGVALTIFPLTQQYSKVFLKKQLYIQH